MDLHHSLPQSGQQHSQPQELQPEAGNPDSPTDALPAVDADTVTADAVVDTAVSQACSHADGIDAAHVDGMPFDSGNLPGENTQIAW